MIEFYECRMFVVTIKQVNHAVATISYLLELTTTDQAKNV